MISRPGRMLRLLRLAADLDVDVAAQLSETTSSRLRALERGSAELGYLEGLLLAKAYLLCPTCFARHFRAAVRGDSVDRTLDGPEPDPTS